MTYKSVRIEHGPGGWGGPLVITPGGTRTKIASVTGGGIHPVAQLIAQLTGAEAVDGFRGGVPPEEMACVVIDCGGTARCGVYPKMNVLTVDVTPTFPSGPLMSYITDHNFVSGVREENVQVVDTPPAQAATASGTPVVPAAETTGARATMDAKSTVEAAKAQVQASRPQRRAGFIERLGRGMGGVVGVFYQAGRETIDQVIRNILPFMAFIAMLIGIILKSGIGNIIARTVSPLASTWWGLLVLSIIAAIPVLSPLLGPGAVIAQVVGVFVGVEIGRGNIPPQYALPALFAIDPQVGCDFVPVGLTLGEAKPETIEVGVPAVLISRQITGPISVLLAYLASFGLYAR